MHCFSLIFGIELCESLRDVCRKIVGFLSRFFTLKILIFGRYVFKRFYTVNRNRVVWKVGGVSEYVFDPCLEGSRVK